MQIGTVPHPVIKETVAREMRSMGEKCFIGCKLFILTILCKNSEQKTGLKDADVSQMDGINGFLSILCSFQKGVSELADLSGDEQRLCLPVNPSLLQERHVQKTRVKEGKESTNDNKEAEQSFIPPRSQAWRQGASLEG